MKPRMRSPASPRLWPDMARSDPHALPQCARLTAAGVNPRKLGRPTTHAELKAEADFLFPNDRTLHAAHMQTGVMMSAAISAELDAKRRAEFGPLWKDVHPRSSL